MTSLQADEAFVEHYQLTHDPFTPRVPGFKFFPAQRKPVLAQLHQLARYSALMQVVSGPLGSGKTLLRQALVASSNKQSVVCIQVSARQASGSAALLGSFSHGLGGDQQDVDGLLGQIARLNQVGQEVYLLVDDAEKLQDEALDVLSSLALGDSDGRAHVFLFGEPELLARLEAQGKAANCHVQQLLPYTLADTRAYLTQRLEGAGQGLELFDDAQIEEIHVESGGWPGAINRVAREVLMESMLVEHQPSAPAAGGLSLPKKHLLAIGVVLAGVAVALVMQGREPEVAEETAATGGSISAQPVRPAIEFEGDGKVVPLPLVGQGQPVPREPLARAAGQAAVEELDAANAAMPVSAVEQPLTLGGVAPPLEAPSASAPAAEPVPAVPAQVTAEPATALAPAVAPVASALPKPAVPAVAPAPERPVATPPVSAPLAGDAGGNWYLSQPVGRYTLQLLGTSSESTARALVSEGGGEYHYFRKLHQGKLLYVVTYGSFVSPEAAKVALAALPSRLQAGKPWPRTFASIQQEIRQAGR